MADAIIRLATTNDVPEIMKLESSYFIGNVPNPKSGEGFVSILHARAWFDSAINYGGLHVAVRDDDSIVGFMAITPPPTIEVGLSPVIAAMCNLAAQLKFDGIPIGKQSYAFRGPVLIDKSTRGQGLYAAFNRICHDFYRDRYEIGVLFVASANPRSLHTTTTKLGATVLTEFEVDEQRYHFLAFRF